ncbi:FAD-dependent monooxygenase [Chitinophagaceae bacterium LB-8]|uniref:FAD-dependent monooxygenase n=1 Tax=Paraflavisolibacter caeni TaxID=2982496 RepID=A0A9X2XX64_9BACT|nr:FAD-dependent monooxygenase [Paraflavisolibacter caeni]MCU7550381.1 FAD-dependent monooxygenase [Paraflavisolibacter caeni]
MNPDSNIDVLIVGAGPTGLMMACQLAMHNIPFRIIDKNEDHTTQSRALVIQARSLEIFDQMGIAEKALQRGKTAKAIGAFFNGKKALRIAVNDMGSGLTKFPNLLMLEQSQTERILVEFLGSQNHNVDRRTEIKSFSQNGDAVTSILKLPDGKEEIIKSKFIIGADGAHSFVREQSGITFGGKTYEESLFVLDCKAEVDIPDDEMYLTFADKAFGGFFPLTNGRWRVLGNIPMDLENKEEITFEDIEKNFANRIQLNVKLYDPQWISAYHSHHRYASTFRKDRCFLAGDAAHIHSPVGAQGMNTGLQDAYNLAWKLALVLKGKAKDSLLDTYTEERIAIAKRLVRSTDRVFKVVTSKNYFPRIFRMYVVPVALKLVAPLFQKIKFIQRIAFRLISEIGISYRNKSLSKNASFGKFSNDAPHPGDRLPFIRFKDANGNETNIQNKVKGNCFCFLIFYDNIPKEIISAIEPFKYFISIEIIPMTSQTEILYKAFGIKKNGCYLIRPDMYIAYKSVDFDAEHLTKYLERYFVK